MFGDRDSACVSFEQLAERGGLQVLVQLAQTDDVVLRDLRVASMRCLASLSTADALKPRLAAAGLPSLLYSAGTGYLLFFQNLCDQHFLSLVPTLMEMPGSFP